VGVSEGGLRGEEWGEQFYEKVLLPCSGGLSEGLVGHLSDGLSWLLAQRIRACRTIMG